MSTAAVGFDAAPGNFAAIAAPASAPILGSDGMRRRDEILVALGRRAIAAPSWRTLAYDAAELVAESLETDGFAVVELSEDRATLSVQIGKTGAVRSDVEEPSESVPSTPTDSLAGYALSVAQAVAAVDLSAETRFQDRLLRQRGVASAAAMPLMCGSSFFGALVIASSDARAFAGDELQYFETIAHLVSTTIAHERTRAQLEQELRFRSAVLDSAESLVMVLSPTGQILQLNRAASKLLGFESSELHERHMGSALMVPEELPVLIRGLEQVANSLNQLLMETWALTKSGDRRRIQWSLAAVTDEEDEPVQIVLTGIDITRQRELEGELNQLRGDSATGEPRAFSPIPEGPNSERRQRLRRAFPYVQMIAPLVNGQNPEEHQFRPVRCRDISPSGFSFLSPIPPDFQDLMVALGGESTTTFVAARVMHATIIEKDNQVAYIVGCRYLSRAKVDDAGK